MWQSGAFRIANIKGIAVDLHLTFGLVIIWGALQGGMRGGGLVGAMLGVASVLLLFACVLLHELGHALQARRLGLAVRRIVLLPIGGLAQLETPPSHPAHELLIALAGPMVNLGLALIAGGYLVVTIGSTFFHDALSPAIVMGAWNVPAYLFSVNLSLFIFNIIPAFPMDGGRVLRAGLALVFPYVPATRFAAWVGRILAIAMMVGGLLVLPVPAFGLSANLLLAMVGIVVFSGANSEEVYVLRQSALGRVEVGQIYQRTVETISPWDTLSRSLVTKLFKYERVLPVLVDERIVGLLGYEDARRFVEKGSQVTVAHAMKTRFPVVKPRDTLWVALQEMTTAQSSMLPVVDENVFRGVVSLDDIDQAWRFVSGR